MSRRCIVSVGTNHWYPKGVERLRRSLDNVGETADRALFTSSLPPGSVPHEQINYNFKFHAIAEAKRRGADSVIWCDASCWAIRQLDPIWAHLEKHGLLLIDCAAYFHQWASDRSLVALNLLREQEFQIPMVIGGLFGMRFSSPEGSEFFQRMMSMVRPEILNGAWKNDQGQVSRDPRVRGHRHDQVLLSHLAVEMKVPLLKQPEIFAYDDHQNETTIFVARGM